MIIHFTNKFEVLESILTSSSFRITYCGEYFGDEKRVISSAAHPMVSFSEYPENEISKQKITYGGYGVALKHEWAVLNKLNPVMYVEKNSQAALGLAALLKARQKTGKVELPSALRLPVMQIKCFTKHVSGYNSYFDKHDFYFKEENEWRFVPQKKDIGGNLISVNYSAFKKNKDKYNNRLLGFPLGFNISDIEAIYVKTEAERHAVCQKFGISDSLIKITPWETTI